ncbi:MAG: hypothetical protein ACOZAR_02890 [Patescibacteria group bacterium]
MSQFYKQILSFAKKINPNIIFFGIYFILAIIVFRGILFNYETVGFRHDWAIAEDASEMKLWFQHAWHAWIDARGGFSVSYLSDFLLRIVLGSVSFLGIGGSIVSKIILVAFVIASGLLSVKYFFQQTNSKIASIFASLIYVFNPLTFNKIISGHVNYLIAYALAPLFLLSFSNYQNSPNYRRPQVVFWLFFSGLIFASLGIQIQLPILVVFLVLIQNFIFPKSWRKTIFGLLFCGLVAFLVHIPWIVVLFLEIIFYKNTTSSTPTLFSWFVHNSSYLYQALMLTGGGTDYFSQTLSQNSLYSPFLVIFCLILIIIICFVLIIKPRLSDTRIFFFFLVTVFILSSAKIFPDSTYWLINQSFVFSIFREVYHLTFLAAFFFAFLIGLTIVKIKLWRQQTKIFYLFIVFILLYISPFFFDGKLINNLQSFSLSKEYANFLQKNNDRLLYLPSLQPLKINNKEYGGFDLSVYYSPNSSISELGYFSSLTDRFATFFQSQLYFNSSQVSDVFPKYLDLFNIDQVVFRNNIISLHDKFTRLSEYPPIKKYFTNSSLLRVLEQYSDKITTQETDWSIYKFSDTDKISISNPCLTTGSWNDFNQWFLLNGPASCNSIFLAKDNNINSLPADTNSVLIANNNIIDLFLQNPGVKYFETGVFANQSNDPKKDWVSGEHIWWIDPSFAGYSKLLSYTSAKDVVLKNEIKSLSQGRYQLFAEIYQQPDGGELVFQYQSWQKKVDTQSLTKHFAWFDLGEINIVDPNTALQIKNIYGANSVGMIMFVPVDQENNQFNISNNLDEKAIGILNDFTRTGIPALREFDLSKSYQTYQNFSDISRYDFNFSPQKITVMASFSGDASQNEFATIIYPLDCDPNITPNIAFNADVSQEKIGFWELGLEIDNNNDGMADDIIWGRLNSNFNYINIPDFISQTNPDIDLSSLEILNFRLQPHKEYSINMNEQVDKKVIFTFSNLKFYTPPDLLTRLPRESSQIDLTNLSATPSLKIKLDEKVSFFNPFPDSSQQNSNNEENKITITSAFSSKKEVAEFSTVIIDTNIDLMTYPYASIDLSVSNPDYQFFDLAWNIDSDYDNLVDQKIWVKSINFDQNNNKTTQFYDVLNLLQAKTLTYQQPRVLAIEILPHKQYNLEVDSMPLVNFDISNLNFYHEAALQSSQKNPFSTLHNEVDVIKSGNYNLYLNVSSQNAGTIDVSFADKSFNVNIDQKPSRQWVKVGSINLQEKKYDLTLITYNQNFSIHNLGLFNEYFGTQTSSIKNKISNFQKISSSQYQSDIHLTEPTYILFKESYHPAWELKVYDGNQNLKETLRPIVVNGWQQAYYLANTGDYHLKFEYSLDPLYRKLLIFSLSFLLFILILLSVIKIAFIREK